MILYKTILITGGAGFIGSNYLNTVVPRYPKTKFINIDCLTKAGSLKNITVSGLANYAFEKVDIKDRRNLVRVFKKYKPEAVIHFAAETHVDKSIKNPRLFLETNILGTENLLSLSCTYHVKRFYLISTDEVYGTLGKKGKRWKEDAPLLPRNPYSASKAAAEHITRAYHKTYGLDIVISRSSNNYGPGQDKSKLIPKFITGLRAGKKVPLYGEGQHIRDWIHVADHVRAIDLVFRKGRTGEAYNIGGGVSLSNLEITKKLLALTGRDQTFVTRAGDRPGHDFRYELNCTKIRRELGWKPHISFDKGLRETVAWYKNNKRKQV